MSDIISFRIASLEDLPIIVDIYNSTVAGRMVTADLEPVTVEDKIAWFYEHSATRRPLWVIEYQNEICAWASLQSFYGRPAYDATAEISIYIHKKYRGHGLGKRILTKVIEECPKLGIETLLGFIFAHNEPSIRLFEAFGFEKWAHLPEVAEMDGIKRDLFILGKKVC